MGSELMRQHVSPRGGLDPLPGRNLRLVDASSVSEPGATGSTWRIHYAFTLPGLRCDEVYVTDTRVGESLKRFTVRPEDVLMADRGYAHREGIAHVVRAGGDVVVRLNLSNVPLEQADAKAFNMLKRLRTLRVGACGDWPAWMRESSRQDAARIAVRVCAIKKSAQATRKTQEKLLAEAARQPPRGPGAHARGGRIRAGVDHPSGADQRPDDSEPIPGSLANCVGIQTPQVIDRRWPSEENRSGRGGLMVTR